MACKILSKPNRNNPQRLIAILLLIYPKQNTLLGSPSKIMQGNTKNNCSNITSRITQYNDSKRHKRSSKASILLSKKNLPNGTKNHERKWERMRERGERFWHNRVVVRNPCENEERGLPFKGGREERPLLDELQVSHIQERENKSRKRHF
jgi:hypothetical protein